MRSSNISDISSKRPYDMNQKIFVSSIFKSGTWLLRDILERLTGLEAYEPENISDSPDYGDAGMIGFKPGRFFSWHSEINGAVKRVVRENDAKAIFLVRNIYDLAVSMYFHFANDTDQEIGRSAGQAGFFNRFERDEGLAMVIGGFASGDAGFAGLGPHLAQIRDMFEFAKEYPVLLTSYERLCLQKETEIRRLSEYLGLPDDPGTVAAIVEATDFDKMKKNAADRGGGSHFRRGAPGGHRETLKEHHLHMIFGQLTQFAPELWAMAREREFPEITQRLG